MVMIETEASTSVIIFVVSVMQVMVTIPASSGRSCDRSGEGSCRPDCYSWWWWQLLIGQCLLFWC